MKKYLIILVVVAGFFITSHAHAASLFRNGFENASTTNKIDLWNANTGLAAANSTTTAPRTGSRAGAIVALTSGIAKGYVYTFASGDGNGPYYLRYYLKVTTAPNANTTISSIQAGAGQQEAIIVLTTASKLQLIRADGITQIGSDSAALTSGTWYCVEVKYDKSQAAGSQIEEAYVDADVGAVSHCGTTKFASATNLTIATGAANFNLGGNFEGETATTGKWFFDDVAFNDSTGSSQTGLPGDGKVIYLRPNAAGDSNTFATQTGGTAGSANNFTRVFDTTLDFATTFNGATTTQEDIFNMDASGIGASDTVSVVTVNGYFRASATTNTATYKYELEKTGSGTKTFSSTIHPVTTAFTVNELSTSVTNLSPIVSYTDPDGAAWTQSTLDSMQAGYLVTSASTNRDDISALWVMVDYNPAVVVSSGTRRRFPGFAR